MRRIQDVLQLTKQYRSVACDNACAAALELRVPEYRFVLRYLERSPQAPLSLRQVDPLTSAVDGSVIFAPASLPGVATTLIGLAASGDASTVNISIQQHT